MIFMRTLVTDTVRLSSKDLPHRLGCHQFLYGCYEFMIEKGSNVRSMAVYDIHTPMMIFMTQLTRVTVNKGLQKGKSKFSWSATLQFLTPNSDTLPALNMYSV